MPDHSLGNRTAKGIFTAVRAGPRPLGRMETQDRSPGRLGSGTHSWVNNRTVPATILR